MIELLVVMAVISILLAVALPALNRARTLAYRVVCGSRLKQIATGWHAYLDDHDHQFYQAFNANHYFGGWRGLAGGPARRPLNRYVDLPPEPDGDGTARLFRCPADEGDQGYGLPAYLYFGNSYQTNVMLIGPDELPTWMAEPIRGLNRRINEHLKNLRVDTVWDPARLLLVGDSSWVKQWDPIDTAGRSWHGAEGRYSLAFLDGHIAFVKIRKGVYIDSDYRIQPFKELDGLTCERQSEISRILGDGP